MSRRTHQFSLLSLKISKLQLSGLSIALINIIFQFVFASLFLHPFRTTYMGFVLAWDNNRISSFFIMIMDSNIFMGRKKLGFRWPFSNLKYKKSCKKKKKILRREGKINELQVGECDKKNKKYGPIGSSHSLNLPEISVCKHSSRAS